MENKEVKTEQKNTNLEKRDNYGIGRFGFFDPLFDTLFPEERTFSRSNLMKTDVKEEDNGYTLSVEVPGINKEDVKINFEDGYLTISASQTNNSDQKNKSGRFIRRERYFGSYERSFYVGDIDKSLVHAKLDNGVLNIFVPKEKEVKEEEKGIAIE